ncbi:hypothetical protein [Actinoplanes sp. NPDC049118]|uniref:hypothetical protein n=1 Tax=Actinoplanes sp. NPDC049118 TaxID=3155769 RepID=UPI0033D0146D
MTIAPQHPRFATIQRRFETFHAEHPEVLERLEKMAGEWFDLGHPSISIGMLWEAMRWLDGVNRPEPVRLNDHFRSRYVRLLLQRRPEWESRFQVRELRAA